MEISLQKYGNLSKGYKQLRVIIYIKLHERILESSGTSQQFILS